MVSSLLEILRSVPDHRRREGQRFELATVLLYAILGMVAGRLIALSQVRPHLGSVRKFLNRQDASWQREGFPRFWKLCRIDG
jgi:hypothetical protein